MRSLLPFGRFRPWLGKARVGEFGGRGRLEERRRGARRRAAASIFGANQTTSA